MGAAFLFERTVKSRPCLLEPLADIPALFIGFTVVLGLLIGSFLNVVIYRVPDHDGPGAARRMRGSC